MTVRWAPPLLALAALLAASHHGAAQAPARSVVQLLDPGSEPRVALRYATPLGAREAVMLTTAARTGLMGWAAAGSTPLPRTRVMVEVGPMADAGADRLMVPFRFTAVDALPTEGVSPRTWPALSASSSRWWASRASSSSTARAWAPAWTS
ncbi:MAG: hypothetical protein IPN77_09770 [Sandaracinaceae bacterium]|nr:hypothetical protein [Sandaracinaceae bacterium]